MNLDPILQWFAANFLLGNIVNAQNALPLGQENTINANSAHVTGYQASIDHYGGQAHAAGMFAQRGDAQSMRLLLRGQTTDATATTLTLDNNSALPLIPQNTTWTITSRTVARRTDAASESAGYIIHAVLHRDTTPASARLVAAAVAALTAEDTAAWSTTLTADTTNGGLNVSVRGEASKTIQWVSELEIVQTRAL